MTNDLRGIRYEAEAMGAICDFSGDNNEIAIDMISLPRGMQGSGIGTDLMWKICDLSDQYGVKLSLEAASYRKFNRVEIGQRKLKLSTKSSVS